jgi:hypothetical protein
MKAHLLIATLLLVSVVVCFLQFRGSDTPQSVVAVSDAAATPPEDYSRPPEGTAPPGDVCEQLRRGLRGRSATELSTLFLPEQYRQHRLLPANARLVLRTPMPWKSVGLCNVRAMVLDYLVLAALVGADVVLPQVPSLVMSSSSPIAKQIEGYFDIEHLRAEWGRFCPSMVLYHDRRCEGSIGPFLEDMERGGSLVVRQPLAMKVRVGSTRSDQDALANNVEKRLDEMDGGIRPWLRGAPRRMIMKRPTNGEGNSTNSVAAVVVNVKKWFLWIPLGTSGA